MELAGNKDLDLMPLHPLRQSIAPILRNGGIGSMFVGQLQKSSKLSHSDASEILMKRPRLLLASTVRWPNVALLAIELANAGCDVFAVCPDRHTLGKTRAVQEIYHYSGFYPVKSLRDAVKSVDPALIVPCDDRAIQHLHELHSVAQAQVPLENKVVDLIERSLGSSESFSTVLTRHGFLRLADEAEILVPKTRVVRNVNDLRAWQADAAFPWVLKADGTSAGNGVKIVYSFKQAEQGLAQLGNFYGFSRALKWYYVNKDSFWLRPWWRNVTPTVTVQAYVSGNPANCAVACWKGELLAFIGVDVVSAKGETGPATVVRISENEEMKKAAGRIAKCLGLSGFFGLDFMIEKETGKTYLIELNPRATRVSCFRLGHGRDPVGALCARLIGQNIQERSSITEKKMIAYFPDSLQCSVELLNSSYQDIPEGEPELVAELLKPWPPQGVAWRLFDRVDRVKRFVGHWGSQEAE